MIKPIIQGFHTNSEDRCLNFLGGDFLEFDDIKWLGKGMYFWDNLGNAEYWVRQKTKKGETDGKYIVIAYFYADRILDLTDSLVLDNFDNLWTAVRRATGGVFNDVYLKNSTPMGIKLNILLQYFEDEFDEMYKVVKGIGEYLNYGRHDFLIVNGKVSRLINEVKVIYAIRDSSIIFQREMYEE